MKEEIAFMFSLVGAFLLSAALVLGVIDLVKRTNCTSYSERTGLVTEYDAFDGCYVDTPSGWIMKNIHVGRFLHYTPNTP